MVRSFAIVPAHRKKLLLWVSALLMAIAVIDALGAGTWDLAAVTGAALTLQLLVLLSIRGARPVVPLRGDLFRWLEARSSATGEPFESIADRCVAAYRAELTRARSEIPE